MLDNFKKKGAPPLTESIVTEENSYSQVRDSDEDPKPSSSKENTHKLESVTTFHCENN